MDKNPPPKAKSKAVMPKVSKPVILAILEDFEVSESVKVELSKKLLLRGMSVPKMASLVHGPNLFAVLRDIYLEVDSKGDFTSFVTHYQKECLK